MDLEALGLSRFAEAFAARAKPGDQPARVASQHYGGLFVVTAGGEKLARIPGRLRRAAAREGADLPVVGDWVVLGADDMIREVLPRATVLARRAAGEAHARQVIAANVDLALLCTSTGSDLSPRRLERYLAVCNEGGVDAVLVLTKVDLAADLAGDLAAISSLGAPVLPVSVRTGQGLDELAALLQPGRTIVLLGSSGVGKSTLVNLWLGRDEQRLQEVRDDGTGRHTTTHRELFQLPGGALVVDTPGMREVGLYEEEQAGIETAFPEIDELADTCRFRDCRHQAEPGCAVREAAESGALPAGRWQAFQRLRAELDASEAKRRDAGRIGSRALRALYVDRRRRDE